MSEQTQKTGPWQLESIDNFGNFGNRSSDKFSSYAVLDEKGRVLFDALNNDYLVSEIHSEHDEYGNHSWDEAARKYMSLAAEAPALLDCLEELLQQYISTAEDEILDASDHLIVIKSRRLIERIKGE